MGYDDIGFMYPPSPPAERFYECPIHLVSSEDCGCVVYDDGEHEFPYEPVKPEDIRVCVCGKPIYQQWHGYGREAGDGIIWWHFGRIEFGSYYINGTPNNRWEIGLMMTEDDKPECENGHEATPNPDVVFVMPETDDTDE